MKICSVDLLIDCMYYEAFENVMDDMPNIKCKTIHYFDEDELVWKTGSAIIHE